MNKRTIDHIRENDPFNVVRTKRNEIERDNRNNTNINKAKKQKLRYVYKYKLYYRDSVLDTACKTSERMELN